MKVCGITSSTRAWLLAGAALGVAATVPGIARAQQAEPLATAPVEEQADDIVITGTRRSLEDALQTKRQSSSIVDSISSEGIGRLPDLNLAESLQRVPGVQISRSAVRRQGTISIRGLPGDFSQTLLNGQYLASPSVSNFPFGLVRSEVFSGIDVIKAQTAANITGGLSGLINLRTGDPLNVPDSLAVSADGTWEEHTQRITPGGAVTFSKQLVPGILGIRGALGFKKSDFRSDNVQVNAYDRIAGAATPDTSDDVFRPRQVRLIGDRTKGTSLSASLGAEWRPTDQLSVKLFGFHNDYKSEGFQTNYFHEARPTSAVTNLGTPSSDGTLGSTYANIQIVDPQVNIDNRILDERFKSSAGTGSIAWSDEVTTITGTLHYTKASRELYTQGFQSVQGSLAGAASNGLISEINTGSGNLRDFRISLNRSALQLVNLEQPFGSPIAPTFRQINALGTPGASFFGSFRYEDEAEEELSFSLDLERKVEWGPLSAIRIGGQYRDKEQTQDNSIATLLNAQLGNLSNTLYDFSLFDGGKSFMNGQLRGFDPAVFGQIDVRATVAALTPVSNTPFPNANFFVGPSGLVNLRDSTSFSLIYSNKQKIYGGYLMVDIDQEFSDTVRLRGNAGLRYEKSERSTVAGTSPDAIDFKFNNWLPALNLALDIGDDIIVRTSYTETLRRPQVDSFAVLRSIGVDAIGSLVTVNLGAGDLLPFRSNNVDVSLEWYNRAGSSVSLLLFHKKVSDYAGTTRICPEDGGGFGVGPLTIGSGVCRTVNATPATGSLPAVQAGATVNINVTANQDSFTLKGFEVSVQQNLSFLPAPWNGFGGQVNYTNVQFSSSSPFRLGEISKHTVNAILYYETPVFGVRAAYNYRSGYFLGSGGTQFGSDRLVKARPQLDLSGSVNVNDRLTLSLEAFNVTNSNLIEYEGVESRVRNYNSFGRTLTFGARYRF